MINKILNKLMRLIVVNKTTRKIALKINALSKNEAINRVSNNDLKINANEILSQIEENGFSKVFNISNDRLEQIIDYSNKSQFTELDGENNYKINYDKPSRPNKALWYTSYNAEKCEAINSIVCDENVLDIAKSYLGKEPKMIQTIMWWSFPPEKQDYNSLYGFHYDIDALKFLKLFIYITDVDENSGPHVIISKTHLEKSNFEIKNRRLKDDKVSELFEDDRINVMTGKKGTAFFEDTFAYHKGTTPFKPRLILQVEYSV